MDSNQECRQQPPPLRCRRRHPQVFRQNKRATDVHDIIGFRIVVSPRNSPPHDEDVSVDSTGRVVEEATHTQGERGGGGSAEGETGETGGKSAARKKAGSKPARSVFTVKTFPPPYRDVDSRLLHCVYEVLVDAFEEVTGRYKVRCTVLVLPGCRAFCFGGNAVCILGAFFGGCATQVCEKCFWRVLSGVCAGGRRFDHAQAWSFEAIYPVEIVARQCIHWSMLSMWTTATFHGLLLPMPCMEH